MKEIKTTRRFDKHFQTRIAKNRTLLKAYYDSVEIFFDDRSLIDDHQLEGKMGLYRAFWINDAYRVVYTETPDFFLFQDVGTHDEVYYR